MPKRNVRSKYLKLIIIKKEKKKCNIRKCYFSCQKNACGNWATLKIINFWPLILHILAQKGAKDNIWTLHNIEEFSPKLT